MDALECISCNMKADTKIFIPFKKSKSYVPICNKCLSLFKENQLKKFGAIEKIK